MGKKKKKEVHYVQRKITDFSLETTETKTTTKDNDAISSNYWGEKMSIQHFIYSKKYAS